MLWRVMFLVAFLCSVGFVGVIVVPCDVHHGLVAPIVVNDVALPVCSYSYPA